jgi:hypothetical protein
MESCHFGFTVRNPKDRTRATTRNLVYEKSEALSKDQPSDETIDQHAENDTFIERESEALYDKAFITADGVFE